MSKHTPTPWKVVERIGQPTIHIDGPGWLAFAELHRSPDNSNVGEANAAFIVTACNAHERLMKAADLLVYLSDSGRLDPDTDELGVIEDMRALLAERSK